MKLAFSTLGCPEWTFGEIITTAKDLGFDGVEIRGLGKKVYAPEAEVFFNENLTATQQYLVKRGTNISLFATGVRMGIESLYDDSIAEIKQYLPIAAALGVRFLRVMITGNPYPEDCNYDFAVKEYRELCELSKSFGVMPLVETNGILAESAVMKSFIHDVANENSGVLWDVHHPFRYFNEEPAKTLENLGNSVRYLHIKDSVRNADDSISYKMLGYGDVPVRDVITLMKARSFDGFISLEWVKRWCAELEDGGIVFAQYMNYMKRYTR